MKRQPILARQNGRSSGATLAVLLAAGICLTVSSCDRGPATKHREGERGVDRLADGEMADSVDEARADGPTADDYNQVATLFGEALVAGEYGAAYQLTSSRLKHRITAEKFTHACLEAVKQFGQAERLGPVAIEVSDGLDGSAASDQYGFPAEIPDDDRLAWVHASLALEVDGDEILRAYDCWMLMENDKGRARVGHFNFTFSQ